MDNFYLLVWSGGYEMPSMTTAPNFGNANKVFHEWTKQCDPCEDTIGVYYVYQHLSGAILLEQLGSEFVNENDPSLGAYLTPIDETKFP